MAKNRAQYDAYSGQVRFDDDRAGNIYDGDAQSIIDSLTRDEDSLYLLACEDELE